MSNTYTWTATNLIGYPQYEGETDVVITVFYIVAADDGQGHTANIQGSQQTPLDPAVPFIPYADLTNDIVIGWVQNALGANGVTGVYANLDAQIEAQINPPQSPESFPLPWGSATGTVSNYVPPAPVAAEAPAAEAPAAEAPATEAPAAEAPAAEAPATEAPAAEAPASEAPLIEPPAPDLSAPVN